MRQQSTAMRGITLFETLATAGCGVVLFSLCAMAAPRAQDGPANPRTADDMTRIRDLMSAVIIYGSESKDGQYPRPGLIDRLPDEQGREAPGIGIEDVSLNTTANLYSALVAQRYLAPERLISPIERNPRIRADDNYDFDKYNPADDVYWDDTFAADLAAESNVSYAHLPMFGERMTNEWRTTYSANYAAFGNRGPKNGKPDSGSHTTDPHGLWSGAVAFNDGHVELLREFAPDIFAHGEGDQKSPDNHFAFDDGIGGADIVLTFTKAMNEDGPVVQFD